MSHHHPTDRSPLSRRAFLSAAASMATLAAAPPRLRAAEGEYPAVRTITSGPKHHWFGYYDKLEFDPTDRYVLSNQVDFEHRTPRPDDVIRVGMVDTGDEDRWVELGSSRAWGWQQGCMLQWVPGTESEIIWNDRVDGRFVSHVKNVKTGEQRTLPRPVYALSPDGRYAVTADFARIQNMRPGYGYQGAPDPHVEQRAPKDGGIWRLDLRTGEEKLIVSFHAIAQIPFRGEKLDRVWHYFNHLLVSPGGDRFIFLNRWRPEFDPETLEASGRRQTRMFTAAMDGSDVRIIDDNGLTSHFIWRDAETILAYSDQPSADRAFYLFKDAEAPGPEPIGTEVMNRDGHCIYLANHDKQWILNDTYPDSERMQRPYLYHVPTGKRHWLGAFHLPKKYTGEWRCDLHPRSSNDGRTVAIDSPHTGAGRQVHLIDVSRIVG